MTQVLTHNEMHKYLQDGSIPDNFRDRLEISLELDPCPNCDNVRCMHFVMRDWFSPDFDDCDGNCCPSCGEWAKSLPEMEGRA